MVWNSNMAAMLLLSIGLTSVNGFNISNTLGDMMVLQQGAAVVWGFGDVGETVTTTFQGSKLPPVTVGSDGVWRQTVKSPASKTPTTISFASSSSETLELRDVLFGDVFLCSGQSNMQYTPHSMAGMNNLTAELAAANDYSKTIRFFTVGMDTNCAHVNCTEPFSQLNPVPSVACGSGKSCRSNWTMASNATLGNQAWNTFSAVCWLTGRQIHDALGGDVPIGLISSNWGGTPIQVWQPIESAKDCGQKVGGVLYNSMIAPFTVGPMALKGLTWYQGESNMGGANYYSCAFPSMIKRWREKFMNPDLWFGFVQIAAYRYSVPYGNPPKPETTHSLAAGDLRQSQLSALQLPNVGMTTAVDTGDWTNIHPPDKQNPSSRLANQALTQIYGKSIEGAMFPMYAGSSVSTTAGSVQVTVTIQAGGKPVGLTTDAPDAATQSTTLGKPGSVPRNQCITYGYRNTFPQDCGYPQIIGKDTASGAVVTLNATATIGADGNTIVLTAATPSNFVPTSSSYGRASWPRTVFFSVEGDKLPVIPWYSNFTNTNPYTPPMGMVDTMSAKVNWVDDDAWLSL